MRGGLHRCSESRAGATLGGCRTPSIHAIKLFLRKSTDTDPNSYRGGHRIPNAAMATRGEDAKRKSVFDPSYKKISGNVNKVRAEHEWISFGAY